MKSTVHRVVGLALLAACFAACEKTDEASFFTHRFSIQVPEFLELPPETSLERFSSISLRLDSVHLLKQALPEAPESIRPQIDRWVAEPHTLSVYQVKQDQVDVFMLGPSSGSASEDRKFRRTLEESITDQVKDLLSEAVSAQSQAPHPADSSPPSPTARRSYSR